MLPTHILCLWMTIFEQISDTHGRATLLITGESQFSPEQPLQHNSPRSSFATGLASNTQELEEIFDDDETLNCLLEMREWCRDLDKFVRENCVSPVPFTTNIRNRSSWILQKLLNKGACGTTSIAESCRVAAIIFVIC